MPKLLGEPPLQFAVCDTNVLISAAILPQSIPGRAVAKLQRGGRLLFSEETIDELRTVLHRQKFDRRLSKAQKFEFLDTVIWQANLIQVTTHITACRDPRDDKFLSLALAAGATHLITGDLDLLALNPFRTLTILTPRDFLAL